MDNRGIRDKAGEELIVITKAYDLAREMTQRVRKLPRDREAGMGSNLNVFRPHTFAGGGLCAVDRG